MPIAAFAPDGVTVGIARCLPVSKSASAEVTVAVAEAWQGRGIATALLERVAARARSVDIEQLTASCPASNDTLIRLLSRLGPTTVGAVERRPGERPGRSWQRTALQAGERRTA